MNKRKNYIDKIKETSTFNNDQKELSIRILNSCEENDIENVYRLLVQRIKTGFKFDSAPATNNQTISLLTENKKLSLYDLDTKTPLLQ